MTEDDCLLWLSSIPKLNFKLQKRLISIFGSAYDVWNANSNIIKNISGIPLFIAENILSSRDQAKFSAYKKSMEQKNVSFISINSPLYPQSLRKIPNPPFGLYVMGDLPDESLFKVSVIGSRKYTQYGANNASKISHDLAKAGVVIVSGMARGIDTVAHKATISAGGKTIAVLGCGVDVCYPPENIALRNDIKKNGCLISEFAMGTRPFLSNFPARNRIISGLSVGVLVIEAAEKSGTLITVRHAREQGRKIMAVPGDVNSSLSRGTNYLIKQGASLVSGSSDVLQIIGFNCVSSQKKISKNNLKKIDLPLEIDEKLVYDIIDVGERTFDYIACNVDLPINRLSSCLITLEIKGLIKKLPGQKYIRS